MNEPHDQGHDSGEDFSKLLGESLEEAEKLYSPGDRVRAELLSVGAEDSFVALGPGKEGVLSTADLRDAEGRVTRRPGESLELFVTSVRPQEVRLSVHPTDRNIAEDLQEAFSSRRPIEGRVVEACKGGFRVSVKGKLAFCPISQIDVKRTETGAEFIGKTFAFRITELSEDARSLVVSRRKLLEEEAARVADAFLARNPDGALVIGKVVRLEKFGAFVELAPGLEGLLHVSEIAWSRVESPADLLKLGQTVTVKLLKREIVEDRLKLSLSLKQATDAPAASPVAPARDPWAKYRPGQVVTGKITRKEPYGLFVELEPGIVGLLHLSKTVDRADFRLEQRKVGESTEVQVEEVRLGERRISLELPRDTSAEEWREQQKTSEGQFGALGDVFKAALKAKNR